MNAKLPAMTIVELLIVVGIIVILTAVTIPSFVGFSERRDFINKVDEFVNEVRLVRNKSLAGVNENSDRVHWGINPECGGTSYELGFEYVDSPGNFISGRNLDLPSKIKFSDGPGKCDTILFERLSGLLILSDPLIESLSIRLIYGDDENISEVIVNKSGQVLVDSSPE